MKWLNASHPDGELLPDWEIHLRDGFGPPGEPLGGVTGPVHTPEAAVNSFLAVFPELARVPLVAVRSPLAPPWSMYECG